ncbi:MAG: DEAD/DEAH box helicase [Akkermansiaceae bacterium]|nr:DEAD/DEAH box helicase [Akkermansiaceae bacterium]
MTPHQAKYLAYELSRRGPAGSMEKIGGALADAKVDLNPHQVEAALFAFKSPLSNGAILADEVGLGKTIEAGILLSQFWAEGRRKILLIMPASLRKQWSLELAEKFYLPTHILEARTFTQATKDGLSNPFNQPEAGILICSYQFAANKEEYLVGVPWDLVVLDEAHRVRNVYKPTNKIANKLRTALKGPRKILLTATPLQNSLLELYGLVSFIDPFAFGDRKSFQAQYARLDSTDTFADLKARLKPLCHRTLRRQVVEFIRYTERIPLTEPFDPGPDEARLYDVVSEYLRREQLFALPSAQRTLMTLILRKLLASSTFAIAGALETLVKKLRAVIRADNSQRDHAQFEFEEDLDGGYEELEDEWESDEPPAALTNEDRALIETEIRDLEEFRDLAVNITENAKGDSLITALEKGFEAMRRNNAPEKAIIFTESRRTQDYLLRRLAQTEYADLIVLFNGSNNDEKSRSIYEVWKERWKDSDRVTGSRSADIRQALVDYFREEAKIMIATEAAAEGINLQFCSLVVNYDLPWNPQRIEQRIGRCHRYGQLHDVVVINFLNVKNAADQRVFELLSEKFNLFSGVFGSSDEVLGSIESGVDFEKRIVAIYQKCRTPDEIESGFKQLQDELEDQINTKIAETKRKLLENFDAEVAEKLRHHTTKSREHLSRVEQLLWKVSRFILEDRATFYDQEHAFVLKSAPYSGMDPHSVPNGRYEMARDPVHAHRYRLHHPLAKEVIRDAISRNTPPVTLRLHCSTSPGQSVELAPLVGTCGSLAARCLSVKSADDSEDHLLLVGLIEGGSALATAQCHRLLDCPGELLDEIAPTPGELERIGSALSAEENRVILEINERHARAFDQEMEKLDHWAGDRKSALEYELRDLDAKIGEAKKQARTVGNLDDKVHWQRQVLSLERLRADKRRDIFEAQDEVDRQREKLLVDADRRLKKDSTTEELFFVRWELV